ncbi:hypothetical protein GEMRC1_002047 [Eukaryota sp. GEM-RC1]
MSSDDPRSRPSLIIAPSERPRVDRSQPDISSLKGRISISDMGSRAHYSGPEQQQTKPTKSDQSKSSFFLQSEGFYHPATEQTASAWRRFLDISNSLLGDLPSEALYAGAEEAVALLKSSSLTDSERRQSLLELYGPHSDSDYRTLLELSSLLTDFSHPSFPGESPLDDSDPVAFTMDEEDEFQGEVMESIELDDSEPEESTTSTAPMSSLFTFRARHVAPPLPTDISLPLGSQRFNQKDFEEVHVPPSKPFELPIGERLIEINDSTLFPSWAKSCFAGMTSLNVIQSKVYPSAFSTRIPLLLCAPTGAGKTNVAVISILKELDYCRSIDGSFDTSSVKIVYIAPMKSLVAEMVASFSTRFKEFGLSVGELTGDVTMSRHQIKNTNIIVTTPEKWDVITRKSGERFFSRSTGLVIIDEIHLLHDLRGPVLESLITRFHRLNDLFGYSVRLVGLSATLPNYNDVASFLRVPTEGLFVFDSSYRPVPLECHFVGLKEKRPLRRRELEDLICYTKVKEIATGEKHQLLVFVHSRKETIRVAQLIKSKMIDDGSVNELFPERGADFSLKILSSEAKNVHHPALQELLPHGIAIHNAGLSRSDRNTVEDLFADSHLRVLISTATLAWGVNLPAHAVIIKSTKVYSP